MTSRVREVATDLTKFQLRALAVIADNPGLKGLDAKGQLEQYYHSEVRHGRLYPNLDDLVDAGLVEKRHPDRRTNAYYVSRFGERVLAFEAGWLAARDGATADTPAVGGEQA